MKEFMSELRIGNYIRTDLSTEYRISEEEDYMIVNAYLLLGIDEERFKPEPIKLTKLWVNNLGLSGKEYKDGYVGIDVGRHDFVLCEPKKNGNPTDYYVWEYEQGKLPLMKQLKYVHQLQNLFFILNEKELCV